MSPHTLFTAIFTALLLVSPERSFCETEHHAHDGHDHGAEKPAVQSAVGNPSKFRYLVPGSLLDKVGKYQYGSMIRKYEQKHVLLASDDELTRRVRGIASRVIANAGLFNKDAKKWDWQINVVNDKTLNAFCMPGGKILFYSGLIKQMNLSDDEIAVIMGHEMAHALREHSRSQLGKRMVAAGVVAAVDHHKGLAAGLAAELGSELLHLKFSRNDETEADIIGLELAARAGYDPRAGASVWTKFEKVAKSSRLEILSDHPTHAHRHDTIEKHLKETMPLYLAAQAARGERTVTQAQPVKRSSERAAN